MTQRTQKGFSIIELLIVVAIIAILTLVALPQYQKYIKRAQISEMLSLSAPLKSDLGVIFALRGDFTDADDQHQVLLDLNKIKGKYLDQAPGAHTASFSATKAVFTFKFGNKANSEIAGSTGFVVGEIKDQGTEKANLQWNCGSTDLVVQDALPKACRLSAP